MGRDEAGSTIAEPQLAASFAAVMGFLSAVW